MSRNLLVRLLTVLLTLVMLLGVVPASAEQAQPTELTFWTHVALHVNWLDWAETHWNEQHPDQPIKFKAEVVPDMASKLMVCMRSGYGAPDIVDLVINDYPSFVKGKNIGFVDLTDIIEPVKDNFVQARLDNYKKDDRYYAIDWHVGASVMYYNTEVLDKAGIDYTTIKTMEDFHDAAQVLKDKTGVPMTTYELTDPWSYYDFVSQNDGDFFDADGNVTLDSAENVEVLSFMRRMIDEGLAIPTPGGGYHSEEYYTFFNAGGAAVMQLPLWYMGRFLEYMPDLQGKIKIATMPLWKEGGNRSAAMGGTATAITTQSQHIDLAKQFLAETKLSYEGNVKFWTILGFDPIRWDTWSDPEVLGENDFTRYFEQDIFPIVLEVKDEFNVTHITEDFPKCLQLLSQNVFFKALEEKSATPEEALKAAADELRAK